MGMSDSKVSPLPVSCFASCCRSAPIFPLAVHRFAPKDRKYGHSQLPSIVTWKFCLENRLSEAPNLKSQRMTSPARSGQWTASLAGRAAPQRSREGPSREKEDQGRQAVTTGVPGGNQTDTMSSVRRGF